MVGGGSCFERRAGWVTISLFFFLLFLECIGRFQAKFLTLEPFLLERARIFSSSLVGRLDSIGMTQQRKASL